MLTFLAGVVVGVAGTLVGLYFLGAKYVGSEEDMSS
jgi:hypothetical protein